jgi:hypothetical protein
MVSSPSRAWVAWSTGPAHVFSLGSAKMAPGADDRARESCGARLTADLAGGVGRPPLVVAWNRSAAVASRRNGRVSWGAGEPDVESCPVAISKAHVPLHECSVAWEGGKRTTAGWTFGVPSLNARGAVQSGWWGWRGACATWTAPEPAGEGTKLRPSAAKEVGWTGNDDDVADVSRVPARTAPEEEAATLLQRAPRRF